MPKLIYCDICGWSAEELEQRADWPGVITDDGRTHAPMVCEDCLGEESDAPSDYSERMAERRQMGIID